MLYCKWVILLNLLHTGYFQFLAIFHNLASNEHGILAKTSKTPINTPKYSKFFLILLHFPNFFLIIQLLLVTDRYGFFVTVRAYKILSAYDSDLCFNVGESPPSLFCHAS